MSSPVDLIQQIIQLDQQLSDLPQEETTQEDPPSPPQPLPVPQKVTKKRKIQSVIGESEAAQCLLKMKESSTSCIGWDLTNLTSNSSMPHIIFMLAYPMKNPTFKPISSEPYWLNQKIKNRFELIIQGARSRLVSLPIMMRFGEFRPQDRTQTQVEKAYTTIQFSKPVDSRVLSATGQLATSFLINNSS